MGLQSARKEKGLSIQDLATIAGLSKRTLEAYESGARDIKKASYQALKALSEALSVPIESLVEGGETMTLKEAWELVCSAECCLAIGGEIVASGDTVEVEQAIKRDWLWGLEVEGFSTLDGRLKIIAHYPEA